MTIVRTIRVNHIDPLGYDELRLVDCLRLMAEDAISKFNEDAVKEEVVIAWARSQGVTRTTSSQPAEPNYEHKDADQIE